MAWVVLRSENHALSYSAIHNHMSYSYFEKRLFMVMRMRNFILKSSESSLFEYQYRLVYEYT